MAIERTMPRAKPGMMPLSLCGVWGGGWGVWVLYGAYIDRIDRSTSIYDHAMQQAKRWHEEDRTYMNKFPAKVVNRTMYSLLVMRRRASQSHSMKSCVC